MAKLFKHSSEVWKSPRVQAILKQPVGTPIDISRLTQAEVDALTGEAKGIWAGHPDIKDSVEWTIGLRSNLRQAAPQE